MSPATAPDTTIDPATILRIAAFCDGDAGGNPAGVWIGADLPPAAEMQRLAHAVGFSETAFAAPEGAGWRVRYFSPAAEGPSRFHTRNPFAVGGVYEDPATGAGTAVLAGYLHDLGWPHGGAIDVVRGEDMGMRSHLHAEIGPRAGDSIRVAGTARFMA